MNKFDIWKKLMHKNAINMLEGVKKILLWLIFERNLAKFFCGAFLSTFWPNCGAFRRNIISHTDHFQFQLIKITLVSTFTVCMHDIDKCYGEERIFNFYLNIELNRRTQQSTKDLASCFKYWKK